MLSCLWDGAYKRTLAADWIRVRFMIMIRFRAKVRIKG